MFYESGMGEIPECCIEQMQTYIDDEDNVARFIAAELQPVGGSPAEKKKSRMERQYVHLLYTKFCEDENDDPVTKRVFYKQMADSFDTCKSDGKRYFVGVRPIPLDDDDERPGSGGS